MKVEFSVGIGRHYEREFIEYEDDTTDEELDVHWQDWIMNYIDGGWDKLEEGL